jgi:hypothetical protein
VPVGHAVNNLQRQAPIAMTAALVHNQQLGCMLLLL